ncbi:hypothetical protein HDU81_004940 [Chytriomyces hyalinus]|nr:hypothetical protein HDU81_004940 [Chytriomyces hyalinus]
MFTVVQVNLDRPQKVVQQQQVLPAQAQMNGDAAPFDWDAPITIIQATRRFANSRKQMAEWGGKEAFLSIICNTSTFFAADPGQLRITLYEHIRNQEAAATDKIQQYRTMAVGVGSTSLAAIPFMLIPVGGWIVTGTVAITNIATMSETDRRQVAAQEALQAIADPGVVFDEVEFHKDMLNFFEVIDRLESMSHAEAKDAAAGLFTIMVIASRLPSHELRREMIQNTLFGEYCTILKTSFETPDSNLANNSFQGVQAISSIISKSGWILQLVGAPGQFALQAVLVGSIKVGLPFAGSVKVLNSVAQQTKMFRMAGKLVNVVAIPLEIFSLVTVMTAVENMNKFVKTCTAKHFDTVDELVAQVEEIQRSLGVV